MDISRADTSSTSESLKDKNCVIAAHMLYHGVCDDLTKYLVGGGCRNVWRIGHEFEALETRRSFLRHWHDGREMGTRYSRDYSFLPDPLVILKDFFFTLFWLMFRVKKPYLYFGFGGFNALSGTLLKRIKRIKVVVFYTIDYTAVRFRNRFLNAIYHAVDKFELKHATETWNLSPRMSEAREQLKGLQRSKYTRQHVVPVGVWFDQILRYQFEDIDEKELVFVGHLLEKQGVQLVLKAVPEILKEIPDFHFRIIGSGEYEPELRKLVKDLGIEAFVYFEGPIYDIEKVNEVIARSAVAVAMYDREKDWFTYLADPTKLKTYLAVGLPIITTDVPYSARELEERRCAIVIDYDVDALTLAAVGLMNDAELLKEYRRNAISYAKELDWPRIFEMNIRRVL